MNDRPLILASASPRRLELLAQIGVVPTSVIPADIDESRLKDELPSVYVSRLAEEKARAVGAAHPQAIVLAADTIVAVGRRVLGKPVDEADAARMLNLLSGRRHRVYTAVAVLARGELRTTLVMTQVRFKRLHQTELSSYLASGEWEGKAGAYAIQGLAQAFIPAINGSYSNVVGLPLCETRHLLEQAGIRA